MRTTTINRMNFPQSVVRTAAQVASCDALEAYWRAQVALAKPGCVKPTALHRDVMAADRVARSLAKAVAR